MLYPLSYRRFRTSIPAGSRGPGGYGVGVPNQTLRSQIGLGIPFGAQREEPPLDREERLDLLAPMVGERALEGSFPGRRIQWAGRPSAPSVTPAGIG